MSHRITLNTFCRSSDVFYTIIFALHAINFRFRYLVYRWNFLDSLCKVSACKSFFAKCFFVRESCALCALVHHF